MKLTLIFLLHWIALVLTQPPAPTADPTPTPSAVPTASPSAIPTAEPTPTPSAVPTAEPTVAPSTASPSYRPTRIPTYTVTIAPSTLRPTRSPSSVHPSRSPVTGTPSAPPSYLPTSTPTNSHHPSPVPTSQPTSRPSRQPSQQPSGQPSRQPSGQPSIQPTSSPSNPTGQPTSTPSQYFSPTSRPTSEPSVSRAPTRPTVAPTFTVTRTPTVQPTRAPTRIPTARPTAPTFAPSTASPSAIPTVHPTRTPTHRPTNPTSQPTGQPSGQPFVRPTSIPSSRPTGRPTGQPTAQPTMAPSYTKFPTKQPTSQPSGRPTKQPSSRPTGAPTVTRHPTNRPSGQPTDNPSSQPSAQPSRRPTSQPSQRPTAPTPIPTRRPTSQPTGQPSSHPSSQPSRRPSMQPTSQPSASPTNPTSEPTKKPTPAPTTASPSVSSNPTGQPSSQPSREPSSQPTSRPTSFPTFTWKPTVRPTSVPTSKPTSRPSPEVGYFTPKPTQLYSAVVMDATGTVEMLPYLSTPCQAVALHYKLTLVRNLTAGSQLILDMPGITSGPCLTPENGRTVRSLLLATSSKLSLRGSFTEGNYTNGFQSSHVTLTFANDFAASEEELFIHIDRLNGLRASCLSSTNRTWSIYAYPQGGTGGLAGQATVLDAFPADGHQSRAVCQAYSAEVKFDTAFPQFHTGVNMTFYLPLPLAGPNDVASISVYLPYFTNIPSTSSSAVNPMSDDLTKQALLSAIDAILVNVTASTHFRWNGYLTADTDTSSELPSTASITKRMRRKFGVTLTFTATGYMSMHDLVKPFWIYIPPENRLTAACGFRTNSTEFVYDILSPYFRINATTFTSVQGMGAACDAQYQCHGRGECDYCAQRCECHDGFGSSADREYLAIGDSMPSDCSARVCPAGPAVFAQPRYIDGRANMSSMVDLHRLVECSSNGVCDRSTGVCKCREGFTGPACERAECPRQCSQRGRCISMERLGSQAGGLPLSLSTSTRYEDRKLYGMLKASAAWDFMRGSQCVCDSSWKVGLLSGQTQLAEFFGPACEFRRCPTGDDPNTSEDETDCEGKIQTAGGKDVGKKGNKCHIDCSNRGSCDYNTGICHCFPGYTGLNCGSKR